MSQEVLFNSLWKQKSLEIVTSGTGTRFHANLFVEYFDENLPFITIWTFLISLPDCVYCTSKVNRENVFLVSDLAFHEVMKFKIPKYDYVKKENNFLMWNKTYFRGFKKTFLDFKTSKIYRW